MSDSDQKKTLTIKRSANESTAISEPRKSTATGARAHRVARLNVEKSKTEPREPLGSDNEPRTVDTGTRTRVRPSSDAPARSSSRTRERPRSKTGERFEERGTRTARTQSTSESTSRATQSKPAREMKNPYEGQHKAFASCPRGMEEVLTQELIKIGLSQVKSGRAGVHFESDWTGIQKANLYSRLATRILVQVAQRPVRSETDIADLARATRWESWFGPDHTLRVDTSAIHSPMKSLQYCNLLVKDGICDRLRDREGARPSIDTVRPDARVHLFLSETVATLYLDTSGESLFKRGWRLDKAQAPIRENLAAGLLALSGWQPGTTLLDPFCGSATILVEAAWIALDIAPGINRPFAFERLRHHDVDQWQQLRREATERIKPTVSSPIIGFETSQDTIEMAQRNLRRASVPLDAVNVLHADACNERCASEPGLILTNPPYGIRIEAENELMNRWASHLKSDFSGWQVGVISADLELPRTMRLKTKRRIPVFNGALDCRLFMFDLVSGNYQS